MYLRVKVQHLFQTVHRLHIVWEVLLVSTGKQKPIRLLEFYLAYAKDLTSIKSRFDVLADTLTITS